MEQMGLLEKEGHLGCQDLLAWLETLGRMESQAFQEMLEHLDRVGKSH